MTRYDIEIYTWAEAWSEMEFHELRANVQEKGEWVKASYALKLKHRIDRMQKRLDELEGRA